MNNLENIPGIIPIKKLAEGGQGEIWHIRKDGRDLVLKKYHQQNATPDQRAVIQQLINTGAPANIAHRFAWPQQLAESSDGTFIGYIMPLIDRSRFISFQQIETGQQRHPGFGALFEICRQLSECFRELHIKGLCYCDISKDNFLFSPETREVILCDNDNIVVDNSGMSSALGTPEYMAPEVVKNEARPSTATDQHSLSVLLFILLCGAHPFHGDMEYAIHILDGVAAQYLYGKEALFVFDPSDRRNRLPDAHGYRHVTNFWRILPRQIQELFQKAFVQGSHNPAMRVTALEWISAFAQVIEQRCVCSCGAENFREPDRRACWNCAEALGLNLCVLNSKIAVSIKPGQQLTAMHLGENGNTAVIGEVESHPRDQTRCLLRNKTGWTWRASLDTQDVEISTERAILLHPGLRIKAGTHEFVVYP